MVGGKGDNPATTKLMRSAAVGIALPWARGDDGTVLVTAKQPAKLAPGPEAATLQPCQDLLSCGPKPDVLAKAEGVGSRISSGGQKHGDAESKLFHDRTLAQHIAPCPIKPSEAKLSA